jgi:hypothetical protein
VNQPMHFDSIDASKIIVNKSVDKQAFSQAILRNYSSHGPDPTTKDEWEKY